MNVIRHGTPVERHHGYLVKREDLSCCSPGPGLAKVRGVFDLLQTLRSRGIETVGVLDTYRSLNGWVTAHVAASMGLRVINFSPRYVHDPRYKRESQIEAEKLGAEIVPISASRTGVMWGQARRLLPERSFMIPNAMKYLASVVATSNEVLTLPDSIRPKTVVIPVGTGTMAAGVISGFRIRRGEVPNFVLHLGYSRSHADFGRYLKRFTGLGTFESTIVDEGYTYRETVRDPLPTDFPCSPFYEGKAWTWMVRSGLDPATTLFWNFG